ncbi:MAG: PrsW family glutamic-type intramembrane protease [Bacteroidota bacterium]
MSFLGILVAIVPSLLIAGFIYWQDKYEREKAIPMLICFILGAVVTMPALFLEAKADSIGWSESESFWMTFFVAFIIVAFNEELFKFIALYLFPFQQKFFNEPFDGIVYAVMIGMGFAMVENILYVHKFGIAETWGRAFTAVPSHGVYAIIMGYYAGLAKFNTEQRWTSLFKGLLFATLLHGAYDLFLLQQELEWLMLLSIVILYGSMFLAWRMIKAHQKGSPWREVV